MPNKSKSKKSSDPPPLEVSSSEGQEDDDEVGYNIRLKSIDKIVFNEDLCSQSEEESSKSNDEDYILPQTSKNKKNETVVPARKRVRLTNYTHRKAFDPSKPNTKLPFDEVWLQFIQITRDGLVKSAQCKKCGSRVSPRPARLKNHLSKCTSILKHPLLTDQKGDKAESSRSSAFIVEDDTNKPEKVHYDKTKIHKYFDISRNNLSKLEATCKICFKKIIYKTASLMDHLKSYHSGETLEVLKIVDSTETDDEEEKNLIKKFYSFSSLPTEVEGDGNSNKNVDPNSLNAMAQCTLCQISIDSKKEAELLDHLVDNHPIEISDELIGPDHDENLTINNASDLSSNKKVIRIPPAVINPVTKRPKSRVWSFFNVEELGDDKYRAVCIICSVELNGCTRSALWPHLQKFHNINSFDEEVDFVIEENKEEETTNKIQKLDLNECVIGSVDEHDVSKSSSARKNKIWYFFHVIFDKSKKKILRVKCKLCGKIANAKPSRFLMHYKNFHPEVDVNEPFDEVKYKDQSQKTLTLSDPATLNSCSVRINPRTLRKKKSKKESQHSKDENRKANDVEDGNDNELNDMCHFDDDGAQEDGDNLGRIETNEIYLKLKKSRDWPIGYFNLTNRVYGEDEEERSCKICDEKVVTNLRLLRSHLSSEHPNTIELNRENEIGDEIIYEKSKVVLDTVKVESETIKKNLGLSTNMENNFEQNEIYRSKDQTPNQDLIRVVEKAIREKALSSTCFLCHKKASNKKGKKFKLWTYSCSTSLCKLLQLDPSFKPFFDYVQYCTPCYQIVTDIDFSLTTVEKLSKKLENYRNSYEDRLKSKYKSLKNHKNKDSIYTKVLTEVLNSLNFNIEAQGNVSKYGRISNFDSTFESEDNNSNDEVDQDDNLMEFDEDDNCEPQEIEQSSVSEASGSDSDIESEDKTKKTKKFLPLPPIVVKPVSKLEYIKRKLLNKRNSLKVKIIKKTDPTLSQSQKTARQNASGKKSDKPVVPIEIFRCTYENCLSTFRAQTTLDVHVRATHENDPTPYHCEVEGCGAKFLSRSSFRYHSRRHTEEPKFFCAFCPLSFHEQWYLRKHIASAHKDNKDEILKFPCNLCGYRYKSQPELDLHLQMHEAKTFQSIPFACVLCEEKDFTNSVDLRSHVRYHHAAPGSFKCEECLKIFKTRKSYRVHIRIWHPEGGERKIFTCDRCGEVSTNIYAFKRHKDTHNPKPLHDCPMCDKKYKRKRGMKLHLKSHTGERPYTCNICPKTFSSSDKLKAHEEIHCTTNNYVCEMCGKSFKTAKNIYQHKVYYCAGGPRKQYNVSKKRHESISNMSSSNSWKRKRSRRNRSPSNCSTSNNSTGEANLGTSENYEETSSFRQSSLIPTTQVHHYVPSQPFYYY